MPFPILGVIHWIFFHKFHNHCIFLSFFFLNCVGTGTSEVPFFKCMYIALYCVWYCMVLHDIDIALYFMVALILQSCNDLLTKLNPGHSKHRVFFAYLAEALAGGCLPKSMTFLLPIKLSLFYKLWSHHGQPNIFDACYS